MIVKYFTSIDLQGKFLVTLILPRQALQFTIVGKAVIRLATTFCLINPSRARLCARYVLLVVNKQIYQWVVVVVKGSACSPSIPTIRVQILLKPTVIGIDIGMLKIRPIPTSLCWFSFFTIEVSMVCSGFKPGTADGSTGLWLPRCVFLFSKVYTKQIQGLQDSFLIFSHPKNNNDIFSEHFCLRPTAEGPSKYYYYLSFSCSSCSGHFVNFRLDNTSGLNLAADLGPVLALLNWF